MGTISIYRLISIIPIGLLGIQTIFGNIFIYKNRLHYIGLQVQKLLNRRTSVTSSLIDLWVMNFMQFGQRFSLLEINFLNCGTFQIDTLLVTATKLLRLRRSSFLFLSSYNQLILLTTTSQWKIWTLKVTKLVNIRINFTSPPFACNRPCCCAHGKLFVCGSEAALNQTLSTSRHDYLIELNNF